MGVYVPAKASYWAARIRVSGSERKNVPEYFYAMDGTGWAPEQVSSSPTERFIFVFDVFSKGGIGMALGQYDVENKYYFTNYYMVKQGKRPFIVISSISQSQEGSLIYRLIQRYKNGERYADLPNYLEPEQYPEEVSDSIEMANRNFWGWKWQNRRVLS